MRRFNNLFLLIIIFIFTLFLGTNVYAKTKNIIVEKIEVLDKSDTISVGTPTIDNSIISSDIVFNKINDFVTFEIDIKNNESSKYKIESIKDNNKNNNIEIKYEYSDDYIDSDGKTSIKIKLIYKNRLLNVEKIDISDLVITLNFINENGSNSSVIINNPTTGDNIFMYIIFFILSISGLILIIKTFNDKKTRYSGIALVIVSLLILPFTVLAIDEYSITFKFTNIRIVGEFEKYNIKINLNKGTIPVGDIVIDDEKIIYDENGNLIIQKEVTYGDKLGDLPENPEKKGYTFDKWTDLDGKTVDENTIITSSNEITANYKVNKYKITYELNGGKVKNPVEYTVQDEIVLNNPTKKGYTFAGWTGSNGDELQTKVTIRRGSIGDKNYVAHFTENSKVSYKVIHMFENSDGTYESIVEQLEGASALSVTPQVMDADGFIIPQPQTITLSSNNENVVTYIYRRNSYNFTIRDRTYVSNNSTPDGEYPYEKEINIRAIERLGYDFRWSDNNTNYERTFLLKNNVNITPIYTARNDIPYTVVHKTMNVNGTNYDIKDEYIFKGTTDSMISPSTNIYEGFTIPSVQTKKIKADGTTIFEYLYERNKYDVSIINPDNIIQGDLSGSYYYGTEITLTAKDIEGYTFNGWSNGETTKTINLEVRNNIRIEAKYSANTVGYKVIHRVMNLNGSYTDETLNLTGKTDSYVTPSVKDLTGFITPPTKTEKIKGNGSTVIVYEYDRIKYQVTINNYDYVEQGNISDEYYYGEELTLTAKDRSGHTFKKWSNNLTSKTINIVVTGNITLGPIYDVNTFTISFDANSGNVNETERVIEENSNIGTLPTATRTNHIFLGWFTDLDGGVQINSNVIPTSNVTYYAHYKKSLSGAIVENPFIDIKIADEKNIGLSNVDESVTYTSNNTNIATVDSEGNVTGIGVGETTITITGNESGETITIIVRIRTNKYLISFDSNGGSAVASKEILIGSSIGTLENPTKINYVFEGWYTSPSGGTKINSNTIPINDTTYYAHYKKSLSNAVIENSSIIILVDESENIGLSNIEEPVTYTSNNPSIASVNSNGTVTGVSVGETTITITGTLSGITKTVNVKVNPILFTITFNSQGGNDISSIQVEKGNSVGTLTIPIKENNIFVGWYTGAENGTKITENTVPLASTTYYAHYKKSLNGAIIANPIIEIDINQSEDIDISNVDEEFVYTSSDPTIAKVNEYGTVTGVSVGETTITITGSESGEEKTVIVKVNSNTYTILFDTQGGNEIDNIDVLKGNKIGTLPVPIRNNYVFIGWYTNISSGTKITENTIPSESTTYYAHWMKSISGASIANQSIVLLVGEEEYIGVSDVEEAITYTSSDTDIATVDEDGNVTGVGIGETTITVTGTISGETKIVNVKVNSNKYTINFDSCGGNEISSREIPIGNSVGNLIIPIKDKYIFIGWFTSEDGGTQINENTVPTDDTTYYAHYKKALSGAEIANSSMAIIIGEEKNIGITGVDEEITYESIDENIATVDENGKVTGVSVGNTTIIVTGIESGDTEIINVSVNTNKYVISFNSDGGSSVANKEIVIGSSIGTLTKPIKANYVFIGWFTSLDGGTQIDEDTVPSGDTIYFAHYKKSLSGAVITNSSIEIYVGQEENIEVLNVDESLVYTSNNSNIAIVDSDGKVTGIGVGETTITITGSESEEIKTVNVTVSEYVNIYTISFNSTGGSNVDDKTITPGEKVGSLDTPTRQGYIFKGWFTSSNGGTQITEDTVPTGDTTYFAHWEVDPFPIVFSQTGECEFNGSSKNITGSECQKYTEYKYIDTNIKLYDSTNWKKDYEIGFTITSYAPNLQVKQAVFVNTKLEDSSKKWPGMVFRRLDATDNIEITQSINSGTKASKSFTNYNIPMKVRIVRKDKKIYYSIDDSDFELLQDMSNFNQQHDITTWFGAAPDGANTPFRHLIGKMSNMYIKLGTMPDSEFYGESYNITFDANGGTASYTTKMVGKGKKLASLPTATKTDEVLIGWYTDLVDGVLVDENTVPTGDTTYYAHWRKSVEFSNISEPSMLMKIGDVRDIYITNIAEIGEDIIYTSSNPSVASVDSLGNVTALSNGTSTITLTGSTSNKYRIANVFVTNERFTVKFKDPNGNVIDTRTYTEGQTLGTLPALTVNPSDSKQIMKGWYTDSSYTTKVSENTVVTSNMNIVTTWAKIASNCSFKSLTLVPGEVDMLGYYYNEGCEDIIIYDYQNDGTYGITGTSDGEVTAIGVDSLSKSYSYKIKGLSSGAIVERTVTVKKPYHNVSFETNGGNLLDSVSIQETQTLTELPTNATKYGYTFMGWFLDDEFTQVATVPMVINSDTTIYAKWYKNEECDLNSSITIINNTMCEDNQNLVTPDGTICRRAKTLHEETCNSTSSRCGSDGYANKNVVYGSCGTSGQLTTGDAFTCDVNGDGVFDEKLERFYYVSDYYNTSTRKFEEDTATLIYYSNVSEEDSCNAVAYKYNYESSFYNGPKASIDNLPLSSTWSNVGLKYTKRTLLGIDGAAPGGVSSAGYSINYSGHSSRLLTAQEIIRGCNAVVSASGTSSSDFSGCDFLLENTRYTSNSNVISEYWLETVYVERYYEAWTVYNGSTSSNPHRTHLNIKYIESATSTSGVRPAIDVPKNKIAYGQDYDDSPYYYITFDPNGGLDNITYTGILKGEAMGSLKAAVAKPGKIFIGWFNSITDGIRIGSDYKPESDMTVYARYEDLTDSTYTVSFDTQGGTSIDDILVTKDSAVGSLPSPKREKYMFDGWYTSLEYTTKVNSSTIVSGDTTYYAKWLKTILAADFPEVVEVHVGETVEVPLDFTTIDEQVSNYGINNSKIATYSITNGVYTYKGVAEGETRHRLVGSTSHAERVILIRVLPQYYTLTFYTQGGDPIEPQRYVKNTKIYSLPTPVRSGYAFVNWGDSTYFHYDVLYPIKITYNNSVYAKWKSSVSIAELVKTEFNLIVNQTDRMVIKNLADIEEKYHYESDDPSIATIDSKGNIVAISPGTTKVRIVGEIDNEFKEATVTVTPIVIKHTLTFDSQGGSSVDPIIVADMETPNSLPIPTKNHLKFVGWYTDTTYETQVTSTTKIESDMILYAKWYYSNFPVVYTMSGYCEFGSDSITYTYGDCSKYKSLGYIDSGVKLYSHENYLNDFEITFSVSGMYNLGNPSKQTLVSAKTDTNSYPGIVMRSEGSNFELSSKMSSSQPKTTISASSLSNVRIVRENERIYYSFNNGTLELLQDIKGYNQYFDLTTWFGAAADANGDPQRYLQTGRISNITIRMGDYQDIKKYSIYFNLNGGSFSNNLSTTQYYESDLPFGYLPEPTRGGYTFVGWFTDTTYTTQVKADTVPLKNMNLYAKWSKAINGATFKTLTGYYNEDQQLVVTGLDTVEEPYEFKSLNTNIATIDENLMVHGVSVGSTTIQFIGLKTGNRVNVTVNIQYRTNKVTFDSQGGSTVSAVTKNRNFAYGDLPTSTKSGYILEGWYKDQEYTEKVTRDYVVTEDMTLYAKWREMPDACENNVQTVLYHSYECPDNKVELIDGKVCKRAVMLHEEFCKSTSGGCYSAGYYANGSQKTTRMVYGNCGTDGVLTPGDAFTCDVNDDGIFDEYSERFYYLGDYYDTNSKVTRPGVASLVYFTSTNGNQLCNSTSGTSTYGGSLPNSTLINLLPTREQWTNVSLVYDNNTSLNSNGSSVGKVDYSNFAARLMNIADVNHACNNTISFSSVSSIPSKCLYLLESTRFQNYNNVSSLSANLPYSYWLETINGSYAYYVSSSGYTDYGSRTYSYSARPVIEVPVDSIQYGADPEYYYITYDYNGGSTKTFTYLPVARGNAISSLPYLSKTDNIFLGWYTGLTDGVKIDSTFVPTSDLVIYARFEPRNKIEVHFDTQGGDPIDSILVNENYSIGTLPTPTREGYDFIGWYTEPEYENSVSSSLVITEEITIYAKWIKTYIVTYESNGGTEIANSKFRINNTYSLSSPKKENYVFLGWFYDEELTDKASSKSFTATEDTTLYAKWYKATTCSNDRNDELLLDYECPNNQDITTADGIVCRRAKVLHQEKCYSGTCKTVGYSTDGSKGTDIVTYGNCGTSGTLSYGDAFTCDINGDGEFNELNERFYYLGTNYNTYTKAYDSDTVSLMYYSNIQDGLACNNGSSTAYSGGSNSNGPTIIAGKLPTTSQWTTTELKYTNRQIVNQSGQSTSSSYYLPVFNFDGKVARFPIYQDLRRQCPLGSDGGSTGALDNCIYVLENTGFANYGGAYMLDTPCYQDSSNIWGLRVSYRYFGNMSSSSSFYPRPVIEVPLSEIDYGQEDVYYKISFDVNGGNLVNNYSAVKKDTAISTLPEPTRDDYRFIGWYTDPENGDLIDNEYVVTGSMTLYAHWVSIIYVDVSFDSQNGTIVDSISIEANNAIGNLPYSIRNGYELEGWYTDLNYTTRVKPDTIITTDTNLYAKWIEIDTCGSNKTLTQIQNITCDDNMNITVGNGIVCKRAELLHQEECTISTTAINKYYCEGDGYYATGSKGTNLITYGSCGTDGVLTAGDAFTCDVNGDGEFNELTERFYYVSDYFDTHTNTYDSNLAVLLYYNNVYQGEACNKENTPYGTRLYYDGPNNAYKQLPTSTQWVNSPLMYTTRQMTTYTGTTISNNITLPKFNYGDKNARLVSYKELSKSCSNAKTTCNFLSENTRYSSSDLNSYYFESYDTSSATSIRYLYTYNSSFNYTTSVTSSMGVRPAIEIPKNKISYGITDSQYKVRFDANGGEVDRAYTIVPASEQIGSLPTPSLYLATFEGWYTGLTDGTKIEDNFTPTSDIVLYAKWSYHPYYTISFVTGEGGSVDSYRLEQNIAIGDLPRSIRPGYLLEGWYLEDTYENRVLPDYVVTSDITLYAKWITSITCYNNEDVTSIHNNVCTDNLNITTPEGTICRRAKSLHEELCTQFSSSSYCSKLGYYNQNISYGSCGTSGQLTVGDAFTCDINGDGEFNELTERFYYISDFYDSSTDTFDSGVATLIYYNNMGSGLACNQTTSTYSSYNYSSNPYGPNIAVKQLAPDTLWTNTTLRNNARQITKSTGELEVNGKTIPVYSYSGYSSRLLTTNEIINGCGTIASSSNGYAENCLFLLENSVFTTSSLKGYYWLENYNSLSEMMVLSNNFGNISYSSYSYAGGVRPAIDVPKNKISYGSTDNYVTVSFDANGGNVNTNYLSVISGSTITSLPEPTYDDKTFDGWYTLVTGGTKIDAESIINNNITVYAHWN